jgi:hypothetical protein
MSAAPFVRRVYEGRDAQRLQDTIEPVAQQIDAVPLLRGVLLKDKTITKTLGQDPTDIHHGLGRPVVGWLVVRQRSAGTVYDEQDDNPAPAKTLRLNTSATVVIDLWVF